MAYRRQFIFECPPIIFGNLFLCRESKVETAGFLRPPEQGGRGESGKLSSLHVLFNGTVLKGSVTAAQVSIWNGGGEAIRQQAILDSVRIRTKPSVPILGASIQKVSRDAIEFSLATNHLDAGVVPVSWKILEKGDGAVVQLIYLGTPSVKIFV